MVNFKEKINFKKHFKKIKTAGIYLLVPIINFAISFITSPIFAKHLTAEEFGYYGYYATLAQFFLAFSSLSLQTYYMSIYFSVAEKEREKIQVSLTLFTVLWNLFFFPITYFSIFLYFKYSHSIIPFYPFALLAFGAASIGVIKGLVQINYRLGQKPFKFLLWVSGGKVLTILASLYFVLVPNMGLAGRMIGIIIVEVIFFIISLYSILKGQKFGIDWVIMRRALIKVLPLLPAALLYWPVGSYDNIVMERLHQPVEMGLFNIGKGISNYLYVALFPFFQTFEPDIYRYAIGYNIKELKKIITVLFSIILLSLIGYWICSPYIIGYLTAGKYVASIKYSNVMAVTFSFSIIFSICDAFLMAWQETKWNLYVNLIGAFLSITLCTLGGLYFKQMGIAYATAITYFVLIAILLFMIRKKLLLNKAATLTF